MMSTAEHPQWTSLRAALERGLTEQGNRNRIVVSGGDGYVASADRPRRMPGRTGLSRKQLPWDGPDARTGAADR